MNDEEFGQPGYVFGYMSNGDLVLLHCYTMLVAVFLSVGLRLCRQQLADNRLPVHSVDMKAAYDAWVQERHLFLFFLEISCVYSWCGLYECKKLYVCHTPPGNKQCDSNIAAVVNSCQGRIHDIFMNSSDKFNGDLVWFMLFFFFFTKIPVSGVTITVWSTYTLFANVPINKY